MLGESLGGSAKIELDLKGELTALFCGVKDVVTPKRVVLPDRRSAIVAIKVARCDSYRPIVFGVARYAADGITKLRTVGEKHVPFGIPSSFDGRSWDDRYQDNKHLHCEDFERIGSLFVPREVEAAQLPVRYSGDEGRALRHLIVSNMLDSANYDVFGPYIDPIARLVWGILNEKDACGSFVDPALQLALDQHRLHDRQN